METLISILVAIIGGLGFLFYRKSKENTALKADKSLTEHSERSKIVDEEVSAADDEIDRVRKEMKKPPQESEEFWKNYKK